MGCGDKNRYREKKKMAGRVQLLALRHCRERLTVAEREKKKELRLLNWKLKTHGGVLLREDGTLLARHSL